MYTYEEEHINKGENVEKWIFLLSCLYMNTYQRHITSRRELQVCIISCMSVLVATFLSVKYCTCGVCGVAAFGGLVVCGTDVKVFYNTVPDVVVSSVLVVARWR